MNPAKILIVEDDIFISRDLQEYLENMDYTVTGLAYDADRAFTSLANEKPDLVLLDINLGKGMDGIEIARVLAKNYQIPFIFLTSYANATIVHQAKQCKPQGYIVKPFTEKSLFAGIEVALFNSAKKNQATSWEVKDINDLLDAKFTRTEVLLLKDIYDGKTNRQLSEAHFVSVNTVKTHVLRIYEKLDVHSRSEAMAKLHRKLA